MKHNPSAFNRMLDLARGARPAPGPTAPPPTPEDIAFLARRSFAAAQRAARVEESWRAWERAGCWSLAGATAALLLVVALHRAPEASNPFDAFNATPTDNSEVFFHP